MASPGEGNSPGRGCRLCCPKRPNRPRGGCISPQRQRTLAGGCEKFGRRTCKPNSVVCGHSSRRRVAADAHQRPTRRFRHVLEPPGRTGPVRSNAWLFGDCFPPYLVLLRVGFTLPPALPSGRCALAAPFHPYPGGTGRPGEPVGPFRKPSPPERARGVAEAVSFLWHWPSTGLEARVPDVIRHTALRSSDFPPPANLVSQSSGSDRPVLLPIASVPRNGVATMRGRPFYRRSCPWRPADARIGPVCRRIEPSAPHTNPSTPPDSQSAPSC
jgi:hypothetical protein